MRNLDPAALLLIDFRILPSVLCWRVGGSFRSGVQPPTGIGFIPAFYNGDSRDAKFGFRRIAFD